MKWIVLLLLACNATFATGCNTLTNAQLNLVEQARRGLDLEKHSAAQRADFVEKYYQLQRDRLDAAFDADVRETNLFSKDWVIEHRKAYSAALDAIHAQQSKSVEAEATAARNLAAVDAALDRLRTLLSIFQRGKDVFDQSQR
ncbi:MAG TPA: hypothetical protein VGP94_12640 [Tepidisphaeraceae bacterium]|nr:hypothetical protein [Tepidisphaeraceae bacterium]